jgi:hypothetical protein
MFYENARVMFDITDVLYLSEAYPENYEDCIINSLYSYKVEH